MDKDQPDNGKLHISDEIWASHTAYVVIYASFNCNTRPDLVHQMQILLPTLVSGLSRIYMVLSKFRQGKLSCIMSIVEIEAVHCLMPSLIETQLYSQQRIIWPLRTQTITFFISDSKQDTEQVHATIWCPGVNKRKVIVILFSDQASHTARQLYKAPNIRKCLNVLRSYGMRQVICLDSAAAVQPLLQRPHDRSGAPRMWERSRQWLDLLQGVRVCLTPLPKAAGHAAPGRFAREARGFRQTVELKPSTRKLACSNSARQCVGVSREEEAEKTKTEKNVNEIGWLDAFILKTLL